MIFDLELWAAYTSVSLILEKLFSRSSFYDIACFSILASEPYLDAPTTIIINCGPLIWMLLILKRTFSVGPGLRL